VPTVPRIKTAFYRRLRAWIDFAMARRWWVIGATAAALGLAVGGSRLVPQQFLPEQRQAGARRRAATQGRLFVRRDDRAG
jgi:multidrug efflux pump subunit AcrB